MVITNLVVPWPGLAAATDKLKPILMRTSCQHEIGRLCKNGCSMSAGWLLNEQEVAKSRICCATDQPFILIRDLLLGLLHVAFRPRRGVGNNTA